MKTTGKMQHVTANNTGERTLRDVIRRELGSEANRRFLARVPAFQPECELPETLLSLLSDLDRAERDGRSQR